jgi:hypothetical protein
MILTTLEMDAEAFARQTGWELKPYGACRGDMCVPVADAVDAFGALDVLAVAERLGMPVVKDEEHRLWALGPSTLGGKTLADARMPSVTLPDRNGNEFTLDSLRGQKVLLLAWASW